MSRKILVTSALPYANGQIHLGHLVEYLQTDIWVRFQRLRGNECHYFCADDTHGTGIMISANKKGITPEEYIADIQKQHLEDFAKFQIEFTHYSSTNSEANKEICEYIFKKMQESGAITTKEVEQAYCEHDKMFLPDRYIKGDCPKCGAKDQYGDSCDTCAATYNPTDLKSPHCSICKNTPVKKKSEHILFQLNHFKDYLKEWVPAHNDKDVSKKLLEWFEEDLRDWDISRDEPYFGFEIPGYPKKYFYVWVDAPIGYIASSHEWLKSQGKSYEDLWKNKDVEIYHFIGKDIVYFHSLFWPAMLSSAGINTPEHIFVHGMLTVNGVKMSKSKGTFINAATYLKHLDPMYLRYYYACKLSAGMDDIDLNLSDFVSRVNSDLIGKITNLISRGAQMLTKKMDGVLSSMNEEGEKLFQLSNEKAEIIAKHFEERNFSKAVVEIRQLAEEGNRYFDEKEPWKLIKEKPEEAKAVLTNIINLYKNIAIFMKPILPEYTKEVEDLLDLKDLKWTDLKEKVENKKINEYKHIAKRIEESQVEKVVEDSKESLEPKKEVESDQITIEDFTKVDLKIAKVIEAEEVPEADKLLKVVVSVGDVKKQVFAGIKSKYKAEDLIGKHVVIVNNLKPRKMRFGMSEGMLLAASGKKGGPFLVTVDDGAESGFQVK